MESVTQLFPGIESAPAVVFTEGSVDHFESILRQCFHLNSHYCFSIDRVTEPKFQYFYPDYSSDVSAASQMANFLLAASGEEEGKIPTAPTSEGVESCEFELFS